MLQSSTVSWCLCMACHQAAHHIRGWIVECGPYKGISVLFVQTSPYDTYPKSVQFGFPTIERGITKLADRGCNIHAVYLTPQSGYVGLPEPVCTAFLKELEHTSHQISFVRFYSIIKCLFEDCNHYPELSQPSREVLNHPHPYTQSHMRIQPDRPVQAPLERN